MSAIQIPKSWALGALSVTASVFFGCAASAPATDASKTAAAEEALTVMDCQNQAAQCLGLFPNASKIMQCRTDLQSCMKQAQSDQQAQASSVQSCASDAMKCAQGAKDFSSAMMCRQSFQDCVGKVVQLPTLPSLPSIPMLPSPFGGGAGGAGGGFGGGLPGGFPGGFPGGGAGAGGGVSLPGGQCQQAGLTCVQAAKTPADVAACATTFRDCIAKGLPTPPIPGGGAGGAGGGLGGGGKLQMCADTARTCVQAAKTAADVQSCGSAFRECAGLPAAPTPPSLPTPPMTVP